MKIVTLVAVAAVCTGCSTKEAEKKSPPAEGIELIDGGALPRTALRYHLTKGVTTGVELAMDLDLAMSERGGAMPTVVTEMEIKAEDVTADGSAKIRTKVTAAAARDRKDTVVSTDIMNAQAAQLAGLELTATLSPHGRLSDSKVDVAGKNLPPSLAAQMGQLTQSLEQVAMPLPDAPVGVGAKWRNRKTVKQNGVEMQTTTTVEVVAIDGDRITFKSVAEVTGADQTVEVAGSKVAIKKIGGGGGGSGTIDLARMVMTGEFRAEFRFDVTAPDQASAPPTSTKIEIVMRMRPLAAQGAQSAP